MRETEHNQDNKKDMHEVYKYQIYIKILTGPFSYLNLIN